MTPAQIAKIMVLVDAHVLCAYDRNPDNPAAGAMLDSRAAVKAALRDAPQAEPTDAKDAARYRYLVVMETKAAPDTVAHYIRNPAHLDRVIEVMEQKP